MGPRQTEAQVVLRRVESIALFTLSEVEKAALLTLPLHVATFETGQDLVREGDRPSQCFAVLDGFVSVYKSTRAGKRQVMTFHVPGDLPDLQSLHLKVLDNSISAVGLCRVGFIPHDAIRHLMQAHPRLEAVFWRSTLIDAALVREGMLNVGRREAYARMAHLFCDLLTRLEVVGLASDHTCLLPMTQPELADAVGVTPVHVNRVLRDLKAAGLLKLRGRQLSVQDWDGLKAAAEFDPTYLHLSSRDAA